MKMSRTVKEQAPRGAETAVSTMKQTKPAESGTAELYGTHQVADGVVFVAFYPQARTVQVAGDFNNWQPEKTPMRKISSSGTWEVKLALAKGTYRYRFVVDGHWQQDPHNKMTEPNPYGGLNSVLKVN